MSLEDAVLDLCAAGDADDIASILTKAIGKRRSTTTRLRSRVDTQPYLRHRKLIVSILADVGEGAESPLEVRYLRDVERSPQRADRSAAGCGELRYQD